MTGIQTTTRAREANIIFVGVTVAVVRTADLKQYGSAKQKRQIMRAAIQIAKRDLVTLLSDRLIQI